MKITLKPLRGDNFDVEVPDGAKVEDLKKVISQTKAEYAPDGQKLIHKGQILKDEQAVSEIGLQPDDFLVIMVAKAKPPAAKPTPAAAEPAPAATPTPAETPAAGGADTAGAAAANMVSGGAMDSTVQMLCDMGFPREEVERCLRAAFNNPDRAVEYLTNGIPEGLLAEQQAAGGGGGGGAAPPPAAGGAGGGASPTPTPAAPAPVAAGGGGGMGGAAFPAIPSGGGGGGAGGGAPMPAALQELRNSPQFPQLAAMVAANPQMLAQILPALGAQHPELMQVIRENPQAFMQLIQEVAQGGGGGGQPTDPVEAMLGAVGLGGGGGRPGGPGAPPPGTQVIRLTQEERDAVDRLCQLGFDRNMAVQAYLACDKNEELAVNFLLDGGGMED